MPDLMMSDSLGDLLDYNPSNAGKLRLVSPFDGKVKSFGFKNSKKILCVFTEDIKKALEILEGKKPSSFIITYDSTSFKHEISFENPEIYFEVISSKRFKLIFKEAKKDEKE